MALRLIQRGKSKIWYVNDRLEGMHVRDCLGTSDKRIAEKRAAGIEYQVLSGFYKLSKKSFSDCSEKYSSMVLSKKSVSSQDRYQSILRNHLLPYFGNMTLMDVVFCDPMTGQSPLIRFFEERSRFPESSLKKIYRVCRDVIFIGYPDFKMPRVLFSNKGFYQKKFLSESDVLLIISFLDEQHQNLALVMAYTGLRLGDALDLRWSEINLKSLMINTVMGKTGDKLRLPISSSIFPIFKIKSRIRNIQDDRLFTVTPRAFQKAWKRARGKAGIEWPRPHDLRHFFCSYLLNHGVDHMTVATLSGHKSIDILKNRYGHFDDLTLKKAVSVFDVVENVHKLYTK